MKKIILILTASFFLIFSQFSNALSIKDAKKQGVVGETSTGYIASVSSKPSPAIQSLISSINAKRKVAYAQKATKAGVSIDVIATRVAERLFQKSDKGSFLKGANGKWYKKK